MGTCLQKAVEKEQEGNIGALVGKVFLPIGALVGEMFFPTVGIACLRVEQGQSMRETVRIYVFLEAVRISITRSRRISSILFFQETPGGGAEDLKESGNSRIP